VSDVRNPVVIGEDGRCMCSCADPCPLHKSGLAYRCTKQELEAAGIPTVKLNMEGSMKKTSTLIPFRGGKTSVDTPDGKVVESGTIGENPKLSWDVFTFGTIHIYDGKLRFKKDCDLFEDALLKVPVDLKSGDRHVIKASGDNDDLVITNKDGEYSLSLTRRGIAVVEKLKELVGKAKSLKKR
jgi:hypothetical protein